MVDLSFGPSASLTVRVRGPEVDEKLKKKKKVEDDYLSRLLQVSMGLDSFDDGHGEQGDNDRQLVVLRSALRLMQATGIGVEGTEAILDVLYQVLDLPYDDRLALEALVEDADDEYITERVEQVLAALESQSAPESGGARRRKADAGFLALLEEAPQLKWDALVQRTFDDSLPLVTSETLSDRTRAAQQAPEADPRALFVLFAATPADAKLDISAFKSPASRAFLEGLAAVFDASQGRRLDETMPVAIATLTEAAPIGPWRRSVAETVANARWRPDDELTTDRLLSWFPEVADGVHGPTKKQLQELREDLVELKQSLTPMSWTAAILSDREIRATHALGVRFESIAYADQNPTFCPVVAEPTWQAGDLACVLGGPEVRVKQQMVGPDGAGAVEVVMAPAERTGASERSNGQEPAEATTVLPKSLLYKPFEVGPGSVVRLTGPRASIGVVVASADDHLQVDLGKGVIDVAPERITTALGLPALEKAGELGPALKKARDQVMNSLRQQGLRWHPALQPR